MKKEVICYVYNNNGNITSVKETNQSGNTNYNLCV